MFKITQRYIASSFIAPFCLSTFFFVSFLLTFQLFRVIRIVTKKGVDISIVLELVFHIGVSFLPMAVPLSALFAAIYTMNKFSEDSELVAMRSFGQRKEQLFFPLLVLGIFISLAIFSLNKDLIPLSKGKFRNTLIKLSSKGMVSDINPGKFFTDIPGVILFAEDVKNGGEFLENLFIKINRGQSEQLIGAKSGELIKKSRGKLKSPSLRLKLRDGNILKLKTDSSDVEKIIFKEYDFPVLSGGNIGGVSKDSMKTNSELKVLIKEREQAISKIENAGQKKNILKNLVKTKLEYWGRFNTPFQTLIFILLGFCLGIKKGRGRSQNAGVVSIVVLVSYYSLFFLGISLAKKLVIAPILVITVPTVLAALAALWFFKKLDWMS